ncbi:MAG: hypothetical protein JW809_05650 [Pirellulales bacterium]|nr:hypothetical protein [Pirellulales bacterium]
MKLRDVIVLLPCHVIEDLSLEHPADHAASILSGWSAPFHPAVVVSARKSPRWVSAHHPPDGEDLDGALVVMPAACDAVVPKGWVAMAESAGAIVVSASGDRPAAVAALVDLVDVEPGFPPHDAADPDQVADLLALGWCYLQVELLTRRVKYMSGLDEGLFEDVVVKAAEAILRGQDANVQENLQRGFDLLAEGRECFYPVETHLLDLTLTAPTTLGEPLRRELAGARSGNLLLTGEAVARLARDEPDTLARLREAVEEGRARLVGGPYRERVLGLLSPESILAELGRGLAAYDAHLGARPSVFGSRRLALCPTLPSILSGLGIHRAIHLALDGGRVPTSSQSRIRWEAPDGAAVEALARSPLDAADVSAYFKLSERLGDAMNLDNAATAVLAHWPGRACPWHDDLKRMSRYAPALGRLVGIDDYFDRTEGAGQVVRHGADAYRSTCLVDDAAAGRPDPISRWVRYHNRRVALDALGGLVVLRQMMTGQIDPTASSRVDALEEEIEDWATDPREPESNALDARVSEALDAAAVAVGDAIPRQSSEAEPGWLLLNPWSFSRRETPEPDDAPDGSAFAPTTPRDVPAMGFAWAGAHPSAADVPLAATKKRFFWQRKAKPEPPMAEGNVLRNEFFEITVDPITGAVRGINDYHSRGNRLGVQLALRAPRPRPRDGDVAAESDEEKDYSVMAAESIVVASAGPCVGQIDVRGRLVDRHGARLARFAQTLRVRRASRVLEIDVELEPEQLPEPAPWQSYYAARFAWGDELAELARSVNLGGWPTEAVQLEAPHFVEIRSKATRTTLLTGGLPYHRRVGSRKLDSILIVHGETARRFRLGVGIDLAHPTAAALAFMSPRTVLRQSAVPPTVPTGWLFHLDVRHVVVTHWAPIAEGPRVVGFRARLLETQGLHAPVGLRAFRPIVQARWTDLAGKPLGELPFEGDRIALEVRPRQWLAVEARWENAT